MSNNKKTATKQKKKQRIDKIISNLGYASRREMKKFLKENIVTVEFNGNNLENQDTLFKNEINMSANKKILSENYISKSANKKILSENYISKSDIKKNSSENYVSNLKLVTDVALLVNPELDNIYINGEKVIYREFIYLMLNKPSGYISATTDEKDKIVLDLIDKNYLIFEPFPVGRLDKDTEGLLVLTNDGQLAHRILSPKKHIDKTYYAKVLGKVDHEDIEKFRQGVTLDDGYKTMSSELKILNISEEFDLINTNKKIELFDKIKINNETVVDEEKIDSKITTSINEKINNKITISINEKNNTELENDNEIKTNIESISYVSEIELTIREGKFHQVKRMFESVGKKVIYLKRISMGKLELDKSLNLGEYRELSAEEVKYLEI